MRPQTNQGKREGIDPRRLDDIGEWAAAGFYEGVELPWPRCYGLAMRRLYENMPVLVPEGRLLIPCEPFFQSRSMESHGVWSAEGLICDFQHHCGLRVNPGVAEDRKRQQPQHAELIDALVADLSPRLVHFGGYTHSNPDMRRVVGEGFDEMEHELDERLATARDVGGSANAETLSLLLALKDYTTGVRAYHGRVAEALRQAAAAAAAADVAGPRARELGLIAESFAAGFLTPARTFLQGMLAMNFAWMLDGCDSIGRPDQVLGDLFQRDVRSGELDLGLCRRLLDELWGAFERFNAWNLQIGGYRPDGRDGTNDLTRECIAACGRNRFRRPNVALRITAQTPGDVLLSALRVLRDGSGRPALYNDDLYVRTLHGMDLGLTACDAREVGFGGCTETMIAGLSNVGSLEGELNLAKALELALHDGYDPVERVQAGPHTGALASFETFDAFLAAVKRQIQFVTDAFVAWSNAQLRRRFTEGDPKLYRTFFTRDCVRRGKSFEAGGARYNWSVVSYQGIANLIDGLAAVRECVFESRSFAPEELVSALDANFEGRNGGGPGIRRKLLAAPKFGNDDVGVDELGRDVMQFAWEQLYAHQPPRGGRYLASCILFVTYAGAGQRVGALPDGRKAGEPLADSVGPAQGRDTHGPTAMLNSVARLPLWLAAGTPVLNIRFQKAILSSDDGLRAAAALVRSFFDAGGLQIQFSVVSRADMLAAQAQPDKYRDLIVRIGGYSEYFTRLSPQLQESVIARTEHDVG